jgi:hypothetical protein
MQAIYSSGKIITTEKNDVNFLPVSPFTHVNSAGKPAYNVSSSKQLTTARLIVKHFHVKCKHSLPGTTTFTRVYVHLRLVYTHLQPM